MASIAQLIENIRTAIYGRDVRESIAAALEQCYSDMETNIQATVDDWLDDHPEATTTVQDGSLTQEKFSAALKQSKINVYDNVSSMKADTGLISGMTVRTCGYYSVDDGGGALYKLSDSAPASYYETLNNGLYAELICDKVVSVKMFGAVGDGTTEDSGAIQNALNTLKDVYFPSGVYLVSTQLVIPYGFFRHVIYAKGTTTVHAAIIKAKVYPTIINNDSGFAIVGLGFTGDSIPTLGTGETPESKAYLYFNGYDDVDIVVKDCGFEKNNCMIYAKGRNMYITGCLFYDMNNANYCIYLDYPDDADGESSTDINGFKNAFSGFRGFLITNNRCHYTRNWLLNTEAVNCQNMKGLVLADNYLEGAFLVRGYLNNALAYNNKTFQVNHYDDTSTRRDACFWLKEMKYTIINGYSAEGSDSYVNKDGVTINEATMAYFMVCEGDAINNTIDDVYVTNFRTAAFGFGGKFTGNSLKANIRRTLNTSSSTISLTDKFKGNIFDIVMNDINNTPDTRPIINFLASNDDGFNIYRVTANYACTPYAGAIPSNVKSQYYLEGEFSIGNISGNSTKDGTMVLSFPVAPVHVDAIIVVATVLTPLCVTSLSATSVGIRFYNASSTSLSDVTVPVRMVFTFA